MYGPFSEDDKLFKIKRNNATQAPTTSQNQQGYQQNLPGFVPKEQYLEIMKHIQIISADLLVFNNMGQVLLGKRTNEPAKNTWFVPGGRIRKNERFPEAVRRIVVQELGIILDGTTQHPKPMGVYHQTYSNNFDNDEFNAHYITFAYTLTLSCQLTTSNATPEAFGGTAGYACPNPTEAFGGTAGYACPNPAEAPTLPKPDHQHSEFKWWSIEDLLASPEVHNYCKNYFHPDPWNKIQCQ